MRTNINSRRWVKALFTNHCSLFISAALFVSAALTSCQDRDLPGSGAMQLPTPDASAITGVASGANDYDYTLTWPAVPQGTVMQVAVFKNGTQQQALQPVSGSSFTLTNLEANQLYEFLFKYASTTEGSDAVSAGVMTSYVRPGANAPEGLKLTQIDLPGDKYDMEVTWTASDNATAYQLTLVNGDQSRTVTETVTGTSYLLKDVQMKERWSATLIAQNAEGKALPVTAQGKVGGKIPAFLSEYATPEELVAQGDDDEASAWLWFQQTYPKGEYLYFGNISKVEDIEDYRMLFWMRDFDEGSADDVWRFSDLAKNAAPVIEQYVKGGGNLLLWQYAVPYIGTINRVATSLLRTAPGIDTGRGSINPDTWNMAVCVNTGSFSLDYSKHPLYEGIATVSLGAHCPVAIPVKGAGWTENHNILFFDIPTILTEIGNTEEACYTALTTDYGLYPLGTWDSQAAYVSQLNVWEAKGAPKAPEGYQEGCGTVLCIGNGGCEFSMKNADGTNDISATPKNNPYQGNILRMAKNAIDYLMSV